MRGTVAKRLRRIAGRIVREKKVESKTIWGRRRSTPNNRHPSIVNLGYVRIYRDLKRRYKGGGR